jgi:hypothetical protein
MNKLIELLNEYEVEKKPSRLQRNYYLWFVHNFWKWIMYIDEEWEDVDDYRTDYEIISKEYGFIKWLVEKDKIDFNEVSKKELATWWNLENNILDEDHTKESWIKFWTEILLMLLAISDTPIQNLCAWLK